MLTNSCVKLQTVHSVPMTMNKDGELWAGQQVAQSSHGDLPAQWCPLQMTSHQVCMASSTSSSTLPRASQSV